MISVPPKKKARFTLAKRLTTHSSARKCALAGLSFGLPFLPVAVFGADTFKEWGGTSSSWSDNNWSGGPYAYGQLEFKGLGNATSTNDRSGGSDAWRLFLQEGTSFNPVFQSYVIAKKEAMNRSGRMR